MVNNEVREPDVAIYQLISVYDRLLYPCMVLELDYKNRTFPALETWTKKCICAQTRTAVRVKILSDESSEIGRSGAVALKYALGEGGAAMLLFAASIGTAPLTPQSLHGMSDEVRDAMQHLEDGSAHEVALVHDEWAHPTLAPPRIELTVDGLWYQDDATCSALCRQILRAFSSTLTPSP